MAGVCVMSDRVEKRENGDVLLYWLNGNMAAKFQPDGCVVLAPPSGHPLDSAAMTLGDDVVEALRDWCDDRLKARRS